ncbi:putative ferric-chelate reductase 1 homolog [Chelonus insularis]|uniref:putative ferric-chelate reductase 1 homolog n=1 Tax=Chelonus insularis TaxID=460826 RepID=UPI00158CE11E|nr:putative ferric-chelate reductase 1 homolog [Chelonus insularis]
MRTIIMLQWITTYIVVLYQSIDEVTGLSSGAPPSTCNDLTPRHKDTHSATSYLPYEIRPAIEERSVKITLGSSQGLPFKGFIINARDIATHQIIGKFENITEGIQPIKCEADVDNTATHTDNQVKHNLLLQWVPPSDYEGTIIFNSTIVQDYATYWIGVESPPITVLKENIELSEPSIPLSSTQRTTTEPYYEPMTESPVKSDQHHPIYDGCGTIKSCFGNNDKCVDDKSCTAIVGVKVKGEKYIFELLGKGGSYIAVGLSNDNKMGDDSVVECIKENDTVSLHMSWNYGRDNMRNSTPDGIVSLEKTSVENGLLYCRFVRNGKTVIQDEIFDLIEKNYYLLLAAGSKLKHTSEVGFHDIIYVASDTPKKLADIGKIMAASDAYIRIHGALMIFSWIGLASIGMPLARYYKQTWVKSQLCGKDQWFAWHRFGMILTWTMTLIAFILIFVKTGGWSRETLHASVGLATTILVFIQPFMAALRPHPNTPRRPLFNWTHWLIGNLAHLFAVASLFFSVRLTKAKIPRWVDWILIAYVILYAINHILLSIAGLVVAKKKVESINTFPMKDLRMRSVIASSIKKDAPLAGFRKIILSIYVFGIALFVIILLVITVLAPIEDSWNEFIATISKY